MTTKTKVPDYKVKDIGEQPVPGYDAWFRQQVALGIQQSKDRSRMIPIEEVRKSFGLDD